MSKHFRRRRFKRCKKRLKKLAKHTHVAGECNHHHKNVFSDGHGHHRFGCGCGCC